MPENQTERMTAAAFRAQYGGASEDAAALEVVDYSEVIAVDPGKKTGLAQYHAHTDPPGLYTHTGTFWDVIGTAEEIHRHKVLWIVEAPHASRPSMTRTNPNVIYSSGRVARESELLVERLRALGHAVIEHDPARQGQKWDDAFARRVLPDWSGPSNEHTRDALRLLFYYNVI